MKKQHIDLVVIGSGPGGYAAAFYAADLGKQVLLVEKEDLGGVCLNRGCIPSKAFLHATHIKHTALEAKKMGLHFKKPTLDLDTLRAWKEGIVEKLSGGIASLAKNRDVKFIKGRAYFEESQLIRIETKKGQELYTFDKAILATGSRPAMPAAFDLGNPRIMSSTEALQVETIPETLLVIGAGYIGMELGMVYARLGSQITLVEALPSILAGADADLVSVLQKQVKSEFSEILLSHKVAKMKTKKSAIEVVLENAEGKKETRSFDKVLVCVGRSPNSETLGLENTKVKLDEKGFVMVDESMQSLDPAIYAIGDIVGGALLAHKASKEARIAVENSLNMNASAENLLIPAVVYTDPEIAWVGLTQQEAKEQGIKVKIAKFSWAASGRALAMNRTEGFTKLIVDPETEQILGVGIVGEHAGELIGEATAWVNMKASVSDIAQTIHAHPTLSESILEAAEVYFNHSSHVPVKKK